MIICIEGMSNTEVGALGVNATSFCFVQIQKYACQKSLDVTHVMK